MWRLSKLHLLGICVLATPAVQATEFDGTKELMTEFEDVSRLLTDVSDDSVTNGTNMTNETHTTTMTDTTTVTTTVTTSVTTTVTETTTMTTTATTLAPEQTVATTVNIAVLLDDATSFDEAAFVAELANATGVDPSDIVVTSTTYTVEVVYELSGAVTEEMAKSTIALANSVTAESVEVTLSDAGAAGASRRLDTRIEAIITALTAAQTNDIKVSAANTDAIVAAVREATGETISLSVVSAPQAKITLLTQVTQTESQASSMPVNTQSLASVATAIEGTIVVTNPTDAGDLAGGAAGGADGGSADGDQEPSAATRADLFALTVAILTGLAMQRQ